MKDIIIANQNRDLQILSYGSPFVCGQGTYRVISKCPAGYMTSYDTKCDSPYQVFSRYKMKHVHSIAFVREDGLAFTVYARTGKKVWITEQLLCELTVGDINGNDLVGTALYCQYQYRAVGAKTWACKAYVMNQEEEVLA